MPKIKFIILAICFFILLTGCSNDKASQNELEQTPNNTKLTPEASEQINNTSDKAIGNEESSAVNALKTITAVLIRQLLSTNKCLLRMTVF